MTRGRDELLDVDGAVAECRVRLGARSGKRALELVLRRDEAHALSSTARCGLEQNREARVGRGAPELLEPDRAVRAGYERDAGRAHRLLRTHLVAHLLDDVRGRPDEDDVVVVTRADELRVLREEPVTRVHGVAPGCLRGGDEIRDPQVALRSGRRADAHRLVCELDVERVAVRRRVDGHGLDPELVERADHAHGDLASIRDEHAVEHAAL